MTGKIRNPDPSPARCRIYSTNTFQTMARFVAFLRGVSPMNLKMADLKRSVEEAGFTEVKTLLSSGNVVFDARRGTEGSVCRAVEAGLVAVTGKSFSAFVRTTEELRAFIEADPYSVHRLDPKAKRVVTFLRKPLENPPHLPISAYDASMLELRGRELLSCYVPGPKGPMFMSLIERTVGSDVTTRTWDTVRKCSVA